MTHIASVWVPLLLASAQMLAAPPTALGEEILPQSFAYSAPQTPLLAKPARLEVSDVTLTEALTTLREHAQVDIVFSPTLLKRPKPVSCACQEATVEEALDRILEGTGSDYFEMPMQIVIRAPQPTSAGSPAARGDLITLAAAPAAIPVVARASVVALQQPLQDVAGTVFNAATGQPLAGALVSVVGTDRGSITNAQGAFRVSDLPGTTVTLRIQLIGYTGVTRAVNVGAENLQFALEQTAILLDEVVVGALGIDRAGRALGYSISRVVPDELTVNRTPNFMDALQGKLAGVNITSLGTGPQGSSKVRIRGQSSFGGNNSPLIVVNGVPIDNTTFGVSGDFGERGSNRNSDSGDGLASINPDDIVDMSVLKGAAAAALYGSRAKDGVIMITTRNRAPGTGIQWEYNTNFTSDTPLDYRDFQMEYGQGEHGQRPMGNLRQDSGVWSFGERFQPGMTQELFGRTIPYEPQPNQFREFYRTGLNLTNTVTVAHGSENGGVSASLSRLDSRAVLQNSTYVRNTVNVGFTQMVSGRYNVSGNVNYSHEDRENPPNIAEQDYSPVIIYTVANSMPMWFLDEMKATEDGNERLWSRFTNRTNPYFALTRFENNIRDRVFGNLTARMQATDWLYVQGRMGQDYYNRDQEYNLPTGTTRQPPAPAGFVNGQYVQDQLNVRELNADFLVGANGEYSLFGVSANFGGNVMRRRTERSNVLVQDFFQRGAYNLSNGRILSPDYTLSERQVNSLYGSAEVGYRDMMFVTGTLRNDWFSTLSPANRSILYPSVSASLVFTEAFTAPAWLSFGKLRAAYAEVGSDTDVPPYADNLFYSINQNFFDNKPLGGISGSVVPNPDLRPMRLSEWEVGTEMILFDNLTLEFGYYERISRDQILNQQISNASGFATRRVNVGESRNRGVELLADLLLINTEQFGWGTNFNAAYNQSTVLDLGTDLGVDQITVGGSDFHGELRQVVGMPLNQLYGWGWLRDEQGRQVFNPNNGIPLRSQEQLNFGSALPVWVGGITNRFNYGDLSLRMLVDFRLGHTLISGTHLNAVRHGLDKSTLPGRDVGCVVGEGVKPDGSVNDICTPVQTFYEALRTHQTSEQSIFNAGSWQLRQITLGYDFTRFLPPGSGIRGLRLNAVANNVAVLKKWVPHVHPDQNGIIGDHRMGLESTGVPVTRGLGVNVNVRF